MLLGLPESKQEPDCVESYTAGDKHNLQFDSVLLAATEVKTGEVRSQQLVLRHLVDLLQHFKPAADSPVMIC